MSTHHLSLITLDRKVRSIRRRIFLQLAELDPLVGAVFGALLGAVVILAMLGGVR